MDIITEIYNEKVDYFIVEIEVIKKIISLIHSEFKNDWPSETYISCIDSLEKKDQKGCVLIVRRNRNIAKDTGTLLSPNDRKLGQNFRNKIVLTIYRINGDITKGWEGIPLWIPNIKLPEGKFFYGTNE